MIFRVDLFPWPGMDPKKTVEVLGSLGFNSLAIVVKPVDGIPMISSGYFGGESDNQLEPLIATAKRLGMEVVAKISVMCDLRLCTERPDLVSMARNGIPLVHPYVDLDWYGFLCPNREEVVSAYVDFMDVLLSNHSVDVMSLDYVGYAFAAEGGRRIFSCYCTHCRDTFRAETGQDPIEISQLSASWVNWRSDRITDNLRAFRKVAKDHGALLEISQDQGNIAQHRIYNMYKRALGLDLSVLPSIIDRFNPRVTHSSVQLLFRQLRHFHIRYGMDVLPEIPNEILGRPEDLLPLLRAAGAAGCRGLALHGLGAQPQAFDLATLRRISELVSF